MPSTARFLHRFLRPAEDAVVEEETTYRRNGDVLPATLYHPRGQRNGLPGWVTLHGLTYHGREHPSLKRFARALSGSGAVVLVPDLPEWRRLEIAPGRTVATIRAAVLELDARELTTPGRVGVMGFSFGATQSLIAATDPALDGHLSGVGAWGGYHDIRRVVRFMFLGEHELDGQEYRRAPDPYGRWIILANYLTLVPEFAHDQPLGAAFQELALEAGRRGIMSWLPELDPVKSRIRTPLTDRQRQVFDLFAPPAASEWTSAQRERVREIGAEIAPRVLDREPLLNAGPHLARIRVPVALGHGRDDRLIPFTEMVRIQRDLPADRIRYAGVTSLFGHSFGEKRLPSPRLLLETVRFVRLLRRTINLV